jgi:SMC interacting uncharacterized protein involved in chromosome segregation
MENIERAAYKIAALKQHLLIDISRMSEEANVARSVSASLWRHLRSLNRDLLTLQSSITIGEAQIAREIRIANDGLKWRVQQREQSIKTLRHVVNSLYKQLTHRDQAIADLEKAVYILQVHYHLHVWCHLQRDSTYAR